MNANNAEKCSIENDLLKNTSCENRKKEQESTNLTEDFSKNEERKNNNFVIIIEEVSDYEKLRLKNIEEKKAFLKNSKLIEKVSSVKWGIQKWESESTNGAVNSSQIRSIIYPLPPLGKQELTWRLFAPAFCPVRPAQC